MTDTLTQDDGGSGGTQQPGPEVAAPTTAVSAGSAAAGAAKSSPRWLLVLAAAVLGVVAGAVGAGLTQMAFPAAEGEQGPAGPAGEAGQQGPAGAPGEPGSASSLDTNKVGYCFDVSWSYSGDASWVDSVSMFAPTSTNGTLSCPVGSFVPLTPTGPNGLPVKNYSAAR